MSINKVILAVFSLMLLPLTTYAQEMQPAEIMPKAKSSLVLDVQKISDTKVVAVGTRGHVLLSNDLGQSWQQAKFVPTRSALTAVEFIDEKHGWAVGHDSVIIHTKDGGDTWSLQYSDVRREQPLLDVDFINKDHGIAIGAYGLFFTTFDGGHSWQEQCQYSLADAEEMIDMGYAEAGFEIDELEKIDCIDLNLPHLYSIELKADGTSYLAGEAGLIAKSDNKGYSWQAIESPYNGSFYQVLDTKYSLLVMGLRGNLYRSEDQGQTWQTIETGVLAGLYSALELAPGKIVIGGMDGVILSSEDDGRTFSVDRRADRQSITSLVARNGSSIDTLIVGSESGISTISVLPDGIKELDNGNK
jgi:photosystem II stability/assembly factor-like uncharacterized protein